MFDGGDESFASEEEHDEMCSGLRFLQSHYVHLLNDWLFVLYSNI